MGKFRRIKFKENIFVLIGWEDGPIAFDEDYEHGRPSYAHLFTDGRVMRYGQQIGTRDDIEFGEEIELHPNVDAFLGLFGPGWL